jgi:hypothetical protein
MLAELTRDYAVMFGIATLKTLDLMEGNARRGSQLTFHLGSFLCMLKVKVKWYLRHRLFEQEKMRKRKL